MAQIKKALFWDDLSEKTQDYIFNSIVEKEDIKDEEVDDLINRTFSAEYYIGDEEV